MSRVGGKPIPVPSGVKIKLGSDRVEIEGPKGKLTTTLPRGIKIEQTDGTLKTVRDHDSRALKPSWGLARSLVANAVRGVSQGFTRELDIVGIGYRAQVEGRKVTFALGYSHPIEFPIPDGIEIKVEKNTHI
ncbi:MAG: 50S ribosomal protein L6, partial [Vicinamibacteria bacterium]